MKRREVKIMKNRMMTWMVVLALMMTSAAPMAMAQTTSGQAGATVPTYLEFAMSRVYKMSVAENDSDPWNDGTLLTTPSFDFGNLTSVKDSAGKFLYMRGEFFYYVMMIAATNGRKYRITETGGAMTGSGGTLPATGVILVPDYQWQDQMVSGTDQGAPPSGATVGPATTACGTGSLVYQSDPGYGRIVRAVISIAGPPSGENYPISYSRGHNGTAVQGTKQEYTGWKPITQDQGSGRYTGTITFTLALY